MHFSIIVHLYSALICFAVFISWNPVLHMFSFHMAYILRNPNFAFLALHVGWASSICCFEIAYTQKFMNFFMPKLDIISGLEAKELDQETFGNWFYANSSFRNSGTFSKSEILNRILIDFIKYFEITSKMNLFVIHIVSGTFYGYFDFYNMKKIVLTHTLLQIQYLM